MFLATYPIHLRSDSFSPVYANCVVTKWVFPSLQLDMNNASSAFVFHSLNARHVLRQELQRSRIVTHSNSDHLSSQNRKHTSVVGVGVTDESFVDFGQDNGKSEWRMDTKLGRHSPV